MSKKTFIPKWPGCSNTTSSGFISEAKFKRYKTKLDGLGNVMTIRTLQEGRRTTLNASRNNETLEKDDFEDGLTKDKNANKGRITQRVGMFRNAKQSQIIYNNVSTAVRRMVDRDIEELVAPESDVQWAPNIPNKIGVSINYRSRNEGNVEIEKSALYDDANARRTKRKDDYVEGEPLDELSKKKRYAELIKDLNLGSSNDQGCLNVQQNNFAFTTPVREACVSDEEFCIVERNNNIINNNNSNNKNEQRIGKIPYPSATLSKRMLATLPSIGLTDDDRKDYDTVALSMMTESIRKTAVSSTSDSNMLSSFMNKTQAINLSSNENGDFMNDPEIKQHEFLIPSALNDSSSCPTTPQLEREFNQTIVLPAFNSNNDILTPRIATVSSQMPVHSDMPVSEAADGIRREILYSYDEMDENQLAESHYATEAVADFWPFEEENANGHELGGGGYSWMNAWEEKSSYF